MPTAGMSKTACAQWRFSGSALVAGLVACAILTSGCAAEPESGGQTAASEYEADGRPDDAAASGAPAGEGTVTPPDGPGDLSVVSVPPQATLDPVPVGELATVDDQFSLRVQLDVAADVGSGRPGEISGDALTVTVEIRNQAPSSRDVSTLFVTVEDAAGEPLSPLYSDPYRPVNGHLQPQDLAEGVYVFTLADAPQPYTVHVSAAAEEPVAVFVGSL